MFDASFAHHLQSQMGQELAQRTEQVAACLTRQGHEVRRLLIADMTRHASQPRLWVLDLADLSNPVLALTTEVSHGAGSDPGRRGVPERFSNIRDSWQTSLGLYQVAEPYMGVWGHSYRLDGMLPRFNDRARERDIVFHPADYVRPGHAGRSLGCPAVSQAAMEQLRRLGLEDAYLYIDGNEPDLHQLIRTCAQAPIWSDSPVQFACEAPPRFPPSTLTRESADEMGV
ncbi:MAG: murein L,D-transpeptidase catalytic domain-containing protein [Lysobacteraceae bacterium]